MIVDAQIALERLVAEAGHAATSAESERLRTALLSSISHDLRTPLASILGSVTSLKSLGDQMSAADRQELLATIEEETERLTRFIANILDMTKLEAGVLETRKSAVDVGDIARTAVERARRARPARRVEIEIARGTPAASADPSLLEQVLLNLLDNADKYSPADSITRIVARPIGERLEVGVIDAGIGIPSDALVRVFDKFYRVAGADGRAPGTGLGLSICAGLVRAMGGSIRAESPVQDLRGTRIVVELPLADGPAASTRRPGA